MGSSYHGVEEVAAITMLLLPIMTSTCLGLELDVVVIGPLLTADGRRLCLYPLPALLTETGGLVTGARGPETDLSILHPPVV